MEPKTPDLEDFGISSIALDLINGTGGVWRWLVGALWVPPGRSSGCTARLLLLARDNISLTWIRVRRQRARE